MASIRLSDLGTVVKYLKEIDPSDDEEEYRDTGFFDDDGNDDDDEDDGNNSDDCGDENDADDEDESTRRITKREPAAIKITDSANNGPNKVFTSLPPPPSLNRFKTNPSTAKNNDVTPDSKSLESLQQIVDKKYGKHAYQLLGDLDTESDYESGTESDYESENEGNADSSIFIILKDCGPNVQKVWDNMSAIEDYGYEFINDSETSLGRENHFTGPRCNRKSLIKALHKYLRRAYEDPNNHILEYYAFAGSAPEVWELEDLKRDLNRR